ncbi:acyl-CoA dehydrogenase family protein [Corynebacterium mayonis]|uniref:acyl-CoA dehydrogenase family protein n=1 Tax=Corynebacterium mayonis TaxID=3062461 RepID=UPI003140277A
MAQATDLLSPTTDYFGVFSDIDGADLQWWATARKAADRARETVNESWENAHYNVDGVRETARMGLLRDGIDIEGFAPMSTRAARLVAFELSRADLSLGGALGVQAGLVMQTIAQCGSEAQKEEFLGPLARAEILGSFALTEPDHGSDSVALETTAVRKGDQWVINGEKKWIGNGSVGDIAIVWARMDDGEVGGFIVDQDTPGYSAETITGKASLRGLYQAHISLVDVHVPHDRKLPGAASFRDTAKVIAGTRIASAFFALGAATDCYEKALDYAKQRVQFGRTLVHNQIIQQRLADMLQELTSMMLYCRHILDLETSGALDERQASLAKVHCTRMARSIAANARDMFGGVGILLENDVMRHMADIEALHTFEGTDTMQSLIVGKAITGVSAFRS